MSGQIARVTEYLDVNLETEMWICNRCNHVLGSARKNYKEFCLLYDRDPTEVHDVIVPGEWTMAPDPEWCRIVEVYCPGCGTMIENEYTPPGHPITIDIELDIDALKREAPTADWIRGREVEA